MATAPLTWSILGTGNIARQFATGVRASRRCRLGAVGSRDGAKAAEFAKAHGIPVAHASYEAAIADPTCDAVYVSLPNTLHHEWTIKALKAGKHVLCEKPLATSLAQAQEMFDVAKQTGRVLIEGFMYRTHPMTHEIVRQIDAGAIGDVRLIRASFCFKVGKPSGNIRFEPGLAGGVLMDVGCYCVSFARLYAKAEPTTIHVQHHRHESGVDDLVVGTLGFASGVLATFSCGMVAHADNTSSVCGSEGYVEIPVPWKPPAAGAQYTIGRSTPPKMDAPPGGVTVPPRQTFTVDAGGDLYGNEADAFAAAVAGEAPPFFDEADSLGNQRVLDEMRRIISVGSA